jgi:hypothetical protein
MIGIVLGAHNHFAVDHFMEVAVLGQGLQFCLGPDLLHRFALRDHGVNVEAPANAVEAEVWLQAAGCPEYGMLKPRWGNVPTARTRFWLRRV